MNQYDHMLAKIYTQANELRKMAPWENLYETDLFGIHIQGSDIPWYVSVMGSEGSFPADTHDQAFRTEIRLFSLRSATTHGHQAYLN